MRPLRRTSAILLHKSKLGEADLRAEVLTQEGEALNLRIHGIRKSRSRSQLSWSPGNKLEIVYYLKDPALCSLKEAELLETRVPVSPSWKYLEDLSSLLELLRQSLRFGSSSDLFVLGDGALRELYELQQSGAPASQNAFRRTLLFSFVKIRIFKILGLLGETRTCTVCGANLEQSAHWQFPELSFLCDSCSEERGVEATSEGLAHARIFDLMSRLRFSKFTEAIGDQGGASATEDLKNIEIHLGNAGFFETLDQRLHEAFEVVLES